MKNHLLWLGPVLSIVFYFLLDGTLSHEAAITAAVTLLCALWWVFEPIPIPATSLIPMALFPLLGVITPNTVALAYGSPLILLFVGGFMLSLAMERSGAHERLALSLVNLFGSGNSKRLVFGFMTASAFLSMWISNTATTLVLLPVAMAVIQKSRSPEKLAAPLLLGIAYAASLGGMGTPIGTPPNLIFMQVFQESTGREISFLHWMKWAIPIVVIFLPLMAIWLTRKMDGSGSLEEFKLSPWRAEEKRVVLIFALTAIAWMTRKEPFGGWSNWLDLPKANDASVALIAAVLLFVIPNGKEGRLLDWPTAQKLPWGVLLLFAGGITIAKAFSATGLSAALGGALSAFTAWPLFLLILCIALAVTFLTEVTSNTATTTLLMPVLAATAIAANMPPELIMVPAVMSASCAFMLPVATAPNAIVFGTGRFTTKDMAREGFILNLIGAAVISIACFLLLRLFPS